MSTAVRPGYKLTEVGVIPEDWEVCTLGVLAAFITSGSRGWARYYSEQGALFIRSQNISSGSMTFVDTQYVAPPPSNECLRTRVQRNDVLVTVTGNSVGNVAVLEDDYGEAYVSQHVGLVRLHDPALGKYVRSYLAPHAPGNRQIQDLQSGQSKPGLMLKDIGTFAVAFPKSKRECYAIANTLADLDSKIASVACLLAKKRDLKQAAMQELLTGKTRLPGFGGEWARRRLGELGTFLKGSGIRKDDAQSGDLPCVRYGELYTHHHDWIKRHYSWVSREVASAAQRLRKGDVLFAGSGETKGEIGKCASFLADCEAYAGGDIVILRPQGVDSLFLGYLCNSPAIATQKASMGQGDAVVHISALSLAAIQVAIPPIAEQSAIASVLSDIDVEISALERRRDKTKLLKQAMMQELLTGRTRLA